VKTTLQGSLALLAMTAALVACPAGHGHKKIGETCAANNDCADVHCEAKVCVKACKTDADCAVAAVPMTCTGNTKTATNPDAYGLCSVSAASARP
jgi:hypothetical protein